MHEADSLIDYSMKFISTPYIWGGNNPLIGFDCSGFVCEVLKSHGYLKHNIDYSANDLLNYSKRYFLKKDTPIKADLLFFGTNPNMACHVAIALNNKLMIESAGGNSKTKELSHAIKRNAFVKIRPIKYRNDLIAIYKVVNDD